MDPRVKGGESLPKPSRRIVVAIALIALCMAAACSPEVGSDAWCNRMKETPSGDWTLNDASEFARSCVLK